MGPLTGIRVLDLTRVVAGPLATRVLADQGAEVIKIEPPEGDLSRTFPPLAEDGVTPYFAQQNAGKRFCSVDLSAPGARELMVDLAAECDAVVENFRPGVMARFGLDADTLCQRFPALVYCSITGFGQDGPWADRRAYAPIGHLESGLLDYDERKTGRVPQQPALVLGDAATAMMAANSINALLLQAARTGQGGHVDVCMVESMVYIQEWVSTELAGGWDSTNAGSCHEAPILHLPDGRCWGLGGNPVAWFEPLAAAMGRADLLADPRFADPIDREANKSELIELVARWAATFTRFDDFRDELEAKTPFTVAELHSIEELAASPWADHRELFTETSAGIRVPSRPARGAGIGTSGHVAARGADNRAVLAEVLGLDDDRLDALTTAGVLTAHS
jgi:crotonobetainyl-CoA:carnitine CoA-transferase CaiB-like acyl-CoA transferase